MTPPSPGIAAQARLVMSAVAMAEPSIAGSSRLVRPIVDLPVRIRRRRGGLEALDSEARRAATVAGGRGRRNVETPDIAPGEAP
jgi:hypothetical protein